MTAVIRLDVVLREAVQTPYSDLVTRPTGVAVRDRVLSTLRDRQADDAQLDFTHVGFMDFSCADEVIAKLLFATRDARVPRIVLRGVREDHADAIEHALGRYDLIVVAIRVDAPGPELLGPASDDWHRAFGVLAALGRAAALPVADALAWTEPRARAALDGLASRRCVIAHPDATFEWGAVA